MQNYNIIKIMSTPRPRPNTCDNTIRYTFAFYFRYLKIDLIFFFSAISTDRISFFLRFRIYRTLRLRFTFTDISSFLYYTIIPLDSLEPLSHPKPSLWLFACIYIDLFVFDLFLIFVGKKTNKNGCLDFGFVITIALFVAQGVKEQYSKYNTV